MYTKPMNFSLNPFIALDQKVGTTVDEHRTLCAARLQEQRSRSELKRTVSEPFQLTLAGSCCNNS